MPVRDRSHRMTGRRGGGPTGAGLFGPEFLQRNKVTGRRFHSEVSTTEEPGGRKSCRLDERALSSAPGEANLVAEGHQKSRTTFQSPSGPSLPVSRRLTELVDNPCLVPPWSVIALNRGKQQRVQWLCLSLLDQRKMTASSPRLTEQRAWLTVLGVSCALERGVLGVWCQRKLGDSEGC